MKGEWVEKVFGGIVQKSKQNKQSTCDVIKVMLFSGFASKELNDQKQNSGISIEFWGKKTKQNTSQTNKKHNYLNSKLAKDYMYYSRSIWENKNSL